MYEELVSKGFARYHMGRLIPVMRGGDPDADSPFPSVPEDIGLLEDEDLQAFADASAEAIEAVAAAPSEFVNESRTSEQLVAEMRSAVESLEAARQEIAERAVEDAAAAAATEPVETVDVEPEAEAEDTLAAEVGELASRARAEEEPQPEPEPEPETEPEVAAAETVVAAAPAPTPIRSRPARARRAAPQETAVESVSLVAAAGADRALGTPFADETDLAEVMVSRRRQFGNIPDGVSGEKMTIARADWSHLYGPERTLDMDEAHNQAVVAAALSPENIKREMRRRRDAQIDNPSLVASGGLCAPVTPYYNLQMLSVADRPVRAALASFNADRGGIRYAAPASLSDISTAVGQISEAEDTAGGTFATKSCQRIDCPPFTETDVETLFHCLEFGNLGARTFPEVVAQWNQLVLAAHARMAESFLLSEIDAASTQVTAQSLGLGATGALLGQILTAVNGMRSRNRMDPEAVLRILLPDWSIDLLISDIIRSQFERFDTDEARITALLRSFDVEPSFYIDGAAGRSQVYGAQGAGALLPFPQDVVWYLYPEGSFLYLDGGVLELGLVRDSVLNSTNDFQIFGESFENVAFVGIESLAVASRVCDSGTVSAPHATDCPINYTHTS